MTEDAFIISLTKNKEVFKVYYQLHDLYVIVNNARLYKNLQRVDHLIIP